MSVSGCRAFHGVLGVFQRTSEDLKGFQAVPGGFWRYSRSFHDVLRKFRRVYLLYNLNP